MTDKKLFTSQAKNIKDYWDKALPISFDSATTVAAALGFRIIPKFINNRLAATPDKYRFADWLGVWTMLATGGIALSYGGTQGLKGWAVIYGVGNGAGFLLYEYF